MSITVPINRKEGKTDQNVDTAEESCCHELHTNSYPIYLKCLGISKMDSEVRHQTEMKYFVPDRHWRADGRAVHDTDGHLRSKDDQRATFHLTMVAIHMCS